METDIEISDRCFGRGWCNYFAARARRGDLTIQEQIASHYFDLLRHARKHGTNLHGQSIEIVSETIVRALEFVAKRTPDPGKPLLQLLHHIQNCVIADKTEEAVKAPQPYNHFEEIFGEYDPDIDPDTVEQMLTILAPTPDMTPEERTRAIQTRKALWLWAVEGWTYAEIAKKQGLRSLQTVASRVKTARKRLREAMVERPADRNVSWIDASGVRARPPKSSDDQE